MKEKIIVIDFGSPKTQILARDVRAMGVYSEIFPYNAGVDKISAAKPNGIIFADIQALGEPVEPAAVAELMALGIPSLKLDADYFQEEIQAFVKDECKCEGDWSAKSFIAEQIRRIKETVGDKSVLCALSGGVDSAVSAALIHKAIGDQLTCIFVDTGLMRMFEGALVEKAFVEQFHAKLVHINAEDRFLSALKGVTDPEQKRKVIGEMFIRVFEEESSKLGQFDFLAQGTIYPDVVESVTVKGATIKSHHNVGGLPENMKFKLVEPLRELFKDEVRQVGLELGLSEDMVFRHPFPGPGLGVRVLGEVTKEKCDILRQADHIAIEELKRAGIYRDIWQAFCILLPVKTVGVKHEKRTYEYVAVFRAVHSVDAMTADWVRIDPEVLATISSRIINEVENINRLVYDISTKPPATIEWE